jgi:hypothetical protein
MTEVRVRNVDDWVVDWHRQQAKLKGDSLESHIRQVLTEAALAKKRALANELRRMRGELSQAGKVFTDSAEIIREVRDSRG